METKKNSMSTVFLLLGFVICDATTPYASPSSHSGHLKPFGYSGPFRSAAEREGFPAVADFFENYVFAKRPLLMKNAAKSHPAFQLWDDDYFRQKIVTPPMSVRTVKKQSGGVKTPAVSMKLDEFVSRYQAEELYMVNQAPPSILRDIALPKPLQCDAVTPSLLESKFWFSNGGTKSSVHIDEGENIMCVYRGVKTFLLIDPQAAVNGTPVHHDASLYHSIDPDRVDYHKYPTLVGVEYTRVDVAAGDCLYIPVDWIHQVSSVNRNIALTFFFDLRMVDRDRLANCSTDGDFSLTADHFEYGGFDGPKVMRYNLLDLVKDGSIPLHDLVTFIADLKGVPSACNTELATSAVKLLDKNGNQLAEKDDILQLTDQELTNFRHFVLN